MQIIKIHVFLLQTEVKHEFYQYNNCRAQHAIPNYKKHRSLFFPREASIDKISFWLWLPVRRQDLITVVTTYINVMTSTYL